MKISFNCHIIYDSKDANNSILEALESIKKGNSDIEIVPHWFSDPTIIMTRKGAINMFKKSMKKEELKEKKHGKKEEKKEHKKGKK